MPTTTPSSNLQDWIIGGVSLIVGTVDAEGVPTCCRAFALTTRDNFETVTVYVPAATGQETMANVATTRRVAISCTKPVSHSSIQIKGVTRGVKLAPPEDEAFVTQRLHEFADVLDLLGLPRKVTHRIAHWPAFAIDVSIEQLFDQTPGPRAGTPLA
jgi:hypothetical protein